jgi:heme exporter protein A
VVSPSPLAELSGVGVRFGKMPVLRSVDLAVGPGEVVGVIGPNGSGKSTLLRVLATLVRATVGTVRVLGVDVDSPDISVARRRLALLGHQPGLWGELTLFENLSFIGRLSGVGTGRVAEILDQVGLGGAMHRRADHSSHGMQRRVEFARVLLTEPDLLLLDEAHAGLDRAAQALVEISVGEVRNRGGAVVLVSHEPDRMLPLVSRTYTLEGGSLISARSLP